MEIHLAPGTEAQLAQLAATQGKAPAQVAEETLARVLQRQAEFVENVHRGMEASRRGDVIGHDEVVDRIDRLFQS